MAYLDPSNFDSPLNVTPSFGVALARILGRGRLMSEREVVGGHQPVHAPHIRSWDTQSWRVAPGSSHISLADCESISRIFSDLHTDSTPPYSKLRPRLLQLPRLKQYNYDCASAYIRIQPILQKICDTGSKLTQAVTLLLVHCTILHWLVFGARFSYGWKTDYREVVCSLTQFLPANGRTIPRIRPMPLRILSNPLIRHCTVHVHKET